MDEGCCFDESTLNMRNLRTVRTCRAETLYLRLCLLASFVCSNGVAVEAQEGERVLIRDRIFFSDRQIPFDDAAQELAIQSLILFDSNSSKAIDVKERGISATWLSQFAQAACKAGLDASISTGDVVNSYLKPLLRGRTKGSGSLFESIPLPHTSPPTYYIIHAWDAPFFELVKQIKAKLLSDDATSHASSPTSVISPDPHASPFASSSRSSTFIWIDVIALPQTSSSTESLIHPSLIKDLIISCSGGSLAVIDSELKIFTRSWCLLELFYSAYYLQPGGLKMIFPTHMDVNLAWDLDQGANSIDIIKAACSLDRDKQQITSEAKKLIGVKRTNEVLRESIRRVSRLTLRWGSLESLAVYCALLIRESELSVLHCTLASLPDLAVDKDLLEEIKGIFKVYDSDNSGELDQEEFVTVLGLAGFSASEATKIFMEVNTDGGEGVGLDEFEEWWVQSQKAQWKASAKKCEMSANSLTALITSFVALLERTSCLDSHSKFFKGWLVKMQDPMHASELFAHGKLIPPVINGDWKGCCDQVTWKLTNDDDSKGCTQLLWRFLLSNADTCSVNIEELSPRKEQEMSRKETYQLLHRQLLELTELLSLHPLRWRQKDYFERAAEEVRAKANCCDEDLPDLPTKKKKGKTGTKDKSWFSFSLISDMVHLKYGEEQTMSRRLIKEAGSALGRWMASNRQVHTGQQARSGVQDLSRSYLTHTETSMDEFSGGGSLGGGGSSLGGGGSTRGGGNSMGKDSISGGAGEGTSFSAIMAYGDRQHASPSPSPTRALKKGISFLPDISPARSPSPAPVSGCVQDSALSESGGSRKMTRHANGSVHRVHLPEVEQIKRSHSVTSPIRMDRR